MHLVGTVDEALLNQKEFSLLFWSWQSRDRAKKFMFCKKISINMDVGCNTIFLKKCISEVYAVSPEFEIWY